MKSSRTDALQRPREEACVSKGVSQKVLPGAY